ncbi:MAG: DEAD/DEAH box helicase [Myxococcales bacterium]|nr:DEAD/DEAH box helicase [Myxococcales bacterium]
MTAPTATRQRSSAGIGQVAAVTSMLASPSVSSPLEAHCWTVACLMGRWTRSKLSERLRATNLRVPVRPGAAGKGTLISAGALLPFVESWASKGMVRTSDDVSYDVDPGAAHHHLSSKATRPLLEELAHHFPTRTTRVDLPSHGLSVRYAPEARQDAVFKCRLAMYLDRLDDVHDLFAAQDKHTPPTRGEAPFICDVVPVKAPPGAVALLPPTMQTFWTKRVLERAFAEPDMPHPDLLRGVLANAAQPEDLRAKAALWLALGPGDETADTTLATMSSSAALCARAVFALREGRWADARQRVHEAFAASRGPKDKRQARLEGFAAPLLGVVLATGDASARALLGVQAAAQRRQDYRAFYTRLLERERATDGLVVSIVADHLYGRDEPALWFPAMLAEALWPLSARHSRSRGVSIQVAESARALFVAAGFRYLADQLTHVCAALEERTGTQTLATSTASLLQLASSEPAWKRALEALETVAVPEPLPPPNASDADANTRLIFCLKPKINGNLRPVSAALDARTLGDVVNLHIEPQVQKRRGEGWDVGRPIPLKKLVSGDPGVPIFRADNELIKAIEASQTGRGTTHEFRQTAALYLSGHPLLFWSESPQDGPVAVTHGKPAVEVHETADGLTLRVVPAPNATNIGILVESRSLIRVMFFGADARAAYDVIRTLPPIPPEGKPALMKAVARLAPLFTIHSDLAVTADAAVTEVSADPRPVVTLTQKGHSLTAKAFVAPLGPSGPQVVPGTGLANLAAETAQGRVRCQRDLGLEAERYAELIATVPELEGTAKGASPSIDDLYTCVQLVRRLMQLAAEDRIGLVWSGDQRIEWVREIDFANLRLQVDEVGTWLTISADAKVDDELVLPMLRLLERQVLSTRVIELAPGRYVTLTTELAEHLGALEAAAQKQDGTENTLRLPPVALWFATGWLSKLKAARSVTANAAAARHLERLEVAYTSQPEVPKIFEAQLRPYQQEGFAFLSRVAAFEGGAILADDMGLGKTLMTLALLVQRAALGPALVVAPVSVKHNWVEEARRFAPTLRVIVLDRLSGDDAPDLRQRLGPFDVLLCSYAGMVNALDRIEVIDWATLVIDEAQAVKNPGTQRAQAARRLLAKTRICLTGTPIENHLGDLFSLMNIANPGLLGDAKAFEDRFAKPIQRDDDREARRNLQTLIAPFILRRRKSEVLTELPPRTEIVLEVEPSAAESAFTEALRRRALTKLARLGPARDQAMNILAEITRLRRAACHPRLVTPNADIESAKLDTLMDLVAELRDNQHRCLVFSQFVDFLALVKARFDAAGVSHEYLDGSTPEKARIRAVTNFQKGQVDAFLISLKAGGFGLNLTAADYVIHLDPWWNPAVEDQASDRAHRWGQTRPVTIYRLVTKGSIEEKVLSLHARKRALAEDLLAGTDKPTHLDVEALLALLED